MTLFLPLAFWIVVHQPADSSAAVRELERIEQQLASSYKAGDCAAWGALLAPEWSVIHITGEVITRSAALDTCKAPRPAAMEFKIDDLSVRVYGDTGIVTGRTNVTTGGANPVSITLRFTDVFVRRDGRWQVVASQATRLGS